MPAGRAGRVRAPIRQGRNSRKGEQGRRNSYQTPLNGSAASAQRMSTSPKAVLAGELCQIAGVFAVVLAIVLNLHHVGATVALVGGMVAFFVGKKLRGV